MPASMRGATGDGAAAAADALPTRDTVVLGLGGSRTLVAAVSDTVERLRGVHASGACGGGALRLTVCRHAFSVGSERHSHNQRIEPNAEREYYRLIET